MRELSTRVVKHARDKSKAARSAVQSKIEEWFGPKPFISSVHKLALTLLTTAGFTWEVRRLGDSKIGLLRQKFRKSAHPRRMVFTPGFGDTPLSWASVWLPLRPILSREVDELVWLDFPGFGGFLHDEPAFDSMDEVERCFKEVIDSLKPKVMVGHSMGGWLTSSYVTRLLPEHQPEKLVLIDPSGVIGKPEEYPVWKERFEQIMDGGSEFLRPHVFKNEPFWLKYVEHEFFYFLGTAEIKSFIRSVEPRHLVENRLDQVRAKTWVIWGELDTLIPTELSDEWLKRLTHPDADPRLVLFAKSGHSPQLEATGSTIAVMTQILLGKSPIENLKLPLWKVKKR